MKNKTDQSYGVVPISKRDGCWRVLLVKQISHTKPDEAFWTFPKGHVEDGESPLQTAARELREETGLTQVQLIESAQFPIHYTFSHAGEKIKKTVTYFLGVCRETETALTIPKEIAALKWLPLADAATRLTHTNTQNVLVKVGQYITDHENSL